jgi:hypothetical protein
MMQSGLLDMLKARYRFQEWQQAGKNREQLFVRNYRVSGDELPQRLINSRVAQLGTNKRVNTSTWVPPGVVTEGPAVAAFPLRPQVAGERPVIVDVFEYESRDRAKEALLELTSQFHQPVPLDVRLEEIGDISVATPDQAWFAFTRGNVLVRVLSYARSSAPARPVAENLDSALVSKPPEEESAAGESSPDLFAGEAPLRADAVRMAVADESPDATPEEQPYIKVFSRGGAVEYSDALIFIPEAAEVQIDVYVTQPGGESVHKRFQGVPGRQSSENQHSESGD